jgi:hypothetical protein
MISFGAESFSCVLYVLHGSPGISKLQFFSKKVLIFCSAVNIFQFLVIKTLDLDSDPDLDPKILGPDPH